MNFTKISLLLLLCFSNKDCFCQIEYRINNSDCSQKEYRVFYPIGKIDTVSYRLSAELRKYKNGQKTYELKYDSLSRVTELLRYSQWGKLVFEGVVLSQSRNKLEQNRVSNNGVSFIPDYFLRTFDSDGRLRSLEYYSFEELSQSTQKLFFDTTGSLVYNEQIVMGDTIQGTFYGGVENKSYKYLQYQAGALVEIWYIENPYNEIVNLVKIESFRKSKVKSITTKRGLRRRVRITPLFHLTCIPCVQNN